MHKCILKIFKFLRDFVYIFKIIAIFSIFIFFIFWAQNLASANWTFIKFFEPYLNACVNFCGYFYSGTTQVLNIFIKHSYVATFIMYCLIYAIAHFIIKGLEILENIYDDSRRLVKKTEEAMMNRSLQKSVEDKEKKIKQFKVYISTSIKKKFTHEKYDIDIQEQNKIMNKFIMEKTLANPTFFKEGFLYSFNDFSKIDDILDVLAKVLKAETPLDYYISIQTFGENLQKEQQDFENLIDTKISNKITILANTAFRYNYNTQQKYKTGQFGVYQKDGESFEVHIFDVE